MRSEGKTNCIGNQLTPCHLNKCVISSILLFCLNQLIEGPQTTHTYNAIQDAGLLNELASHSDNILPLWLTCTPSPVQCWAGLSGWSLPGCGDSGHRCWLHICHSDGRKKTGQVNLMLGCQLISTNRKLALVTVEDYDACSELFDVSDSGDGGSIWLQEMFVHSLNISIRSQLWIRPSQHLTGSAPNDPGPLKPNELSVANRTQRGVESSCNACGLVVLECLLWLLWALF